MMKYTGVTCRNNRPRNVTIFQTVSRFTSWSGYDSSCFIEGLHKLAEKLPHEQEILNTQIYLRVLHYSLRAFARSVQRLHGSCSIDFCLPLNVTTLCQPSASCSKGATSADLGVLCPPELVISSSWCVKTRMPLSLSVQLHGHIHKHKHYLPV